MEIKTEKDENYTIITFVSPTEGAKARTEAL